MPETATSAARLPNERLLIVGADSYCDRASGAREHLVTKSGSAARGDRSRSVEKLTVTMGRREAYVRTATMPTPLSLEPRVLFPRRKVFPRQATVVKAEDAVAALSR
jgi:hypothetical protein